MDKLNFLKDDCFVYIIGRCDMYVIFYIVCMNEMDKNDFKIDYSLYFCFIVFFRKGDV